MQQLKNKEQELSFMAQKQKEQHERLKQMMEELQFREKKLFERELVMKLNNAPTPIKRKGKFSKARLKVNQI